MTSINVDKLSLKELVSLELKIRSAIVQARARGRVELKNKMTEMAIVHGFSIAELFNGAKAAKKNVSAAKYANPDDNSETYTGRGRRPFWLAARLKKGAALEDFAI